MKKQFFSLTLLLIMMAMIGSCNRNANDIPQTTENLQNLDENRPASGTSNEVQPEYVDPSAVPTTPEPSSGAIVTPETNSTNLNQAEEME